MTAHFPPTGSPGHVTPWLAERSGLEVCGLGPAALLQGQLTAFFASRQCHGAAILKATRWALQQARRSCPVIGGFHSPLEQSVLRLLLEAGSPVVVVLARPVTSALLRGRWRDAMAAGRLVVVSRSENARRLTEQAADDRNQLVAQLANRIVIAHASPAGTLSRQCERWATEGLDVRHIDDVDLAH